MWTSRWGVFSGHVEPLRRVSAEKNLRPPFLARKRPDFGPISLLRWPVCVSNGAVVHVDGQQSKKMHGQQNSEALNQVQQSRVSSENPTSLNFFHLFENISRTKIGPPDPGSARQETQFKHLLASSGPLGRWGQGGSCRCPKSHTLHSKSSLVFKIRVRPY